jgi:Pvc16 N-terminal domain
MTTPLGVAAVSAVLRTVLNNGITEANLAAIVGGNITVSSLPPDRVPLNGAQEPNQLNLFLYHTSFNQGWRNAALPSRSASGERTSNPPLALDLHYILSAYGMQDFAPEVILGQGMHTLHEHPVLTRGAIRRALSPPLPPGVPSEFLESRLADQVEQITVSPETLTTEEVSRLWSAMQAHYRPSAAYQVTVVLLETPRSTSGALPVLAVSSATLPLPRIVVDKIIPEAGEGTPILPDSTLLITGQNLRGADTRVLIGGIEFVPAANDVSSTQIRLPLPMPPPVGLRAGFTGVQVVLGIPLGVPPTQRTIFKSESIGVALRPVITPTTQNITSTVIDGVTFRSGQVRVNFVPNVGRTQQLLLLLNEFNPSSARPARAYSFAAPADNGITDPAAADTPAVTFPFRNVLPGQYLVRVLIDGAESPLTVSGGVLSSPQVTV